MSDHTEKQPMSDDSDRLDQLIGLACDDALTSADAQELADALRGSSSAREGYLQAMGLEGLLVSEHDTDPTEFFSVLEAHPVAGAHETDTEETTASTTLTAGWPSDLRRLAVLSTIAAAMLLTTFGLKGWERTVAQGPADFVVAPRAAIGIQVGEIAELQHVRWAPDSLVSGGASLVGGQRLRLLEGSARLRLNEGVSVTLEGPAEIEIVSGNTLRATSGTLHAVAMASAEGFVIQTPSAHLVQVGPDHSAQPVSSSFSDVRLAIRHDGATEVAVDGGRLQLQYAKGSGIRGRRPLTGNLSVRDLRAETTVLSGEAFSIDRAGELHRLSTLDMESPESELTLKRMVPAISGVYATSRGEARQPNCRVVVNGFTEDAPAFVDRLHQWNGVTAAGLPEFLRKGDYVRTFNVDKWDAEAQLTIDLDRPSTLYVLMDDRVEVPLWLRERFTDTGADVGLDEGWRDANGRRYLVGRSGGLRELNATSRESGKFPSTISLGVGPADSIDATFSVWRFTQTAIGRVRLGPPGFATERSSMYGVVAVGL